MADSDLADLRKQCIESLYLCTENVSKYLDSQKDDEFAKLLACVEQYCLMEAKEDLESKALAMAKRETDASNLDTLDMKYSAHLQKLMEKSRFKVDNHPFIVEFKRKMQLVRQQSVAQNANDSDVAIMETQRVYIDPITKKPVEDPVRNTNCGHVYERQAILYYIQRNRNKAKCPEAGCGNQVPIQIEHLIEDEELRTQVRNSNANNDTQQNSSFLDENDSF